MNSDFLKLVEAEVARRFPLLRDFQIGTTADPETAPVPTFIGLVAAVMESSRDPCCIVVPDPSGVTLMAGTLKALTALREKAPDILRSAARASMQLGDRVLVNPTGLVYEYEGFFTPDHFKLKVIDRNERRSLAVGDVARLEKTTRKRPKGQLNSDLGLLVPTILGTLVGIPGTVNRNLLRNYVLLLGHKNRFRELSTDWTIAAHGAIGTFEDEIPLEDDVRVLQRDLYVLHSGRLLLHVKLQVQRETAKKNLVIHSFPGIAGSTRRPPSPSHASAATVFTAFQEPAGASSPEDKQLQFAVTILPLLRNRRGHHGGRHHPRP